MNSSKKSSAIVLTYSIHNYFCAITYVFILGILNSSADHACI